MATPVAPPPRTGQSKPAIAIDYRGRRFRPVDNPHYPAGAPTPTGRYQQDGDLVWAEFSGAGIRAGRLVGRCLPDGTIHASYCWLTAAGETMAGTCVSSPTVLADGRVRLTERWRRMDGSVGVSYVEEFRDDPEAVDTGEVEGRGG